MANIGSFNASEVEPQAPRDIIPPGKYVAHIVQSEMRGTKAGNGQMLALEFDILDGPHKGRKLWDRLNLDNPNAQAVEIAQRTLSSICHAVNVLQITDSEALHHKPLLLTVKVNPAGPDRTGTMREESNSISGYAAANGTAPAASGNRPPPPAAAAKPAMPWQRKTT